MDFGGPKKSEIKGNSAKFKICFLDFEGSIPHCYPP